MNISKSQKRMLIRIAVRLSILAVLVIQIIGQYKSISNLKNENKTIYEQITTLEKTVENINCNVTVETADETEPVLQYTYIGDLKITGYVANCEHCCGKSDGLTASMTEATVGRTVAMNRTDMKNLGIEFGDVIYINGIGERVVEDTGCGQGVIDVVCNSHEDCYKITGTYEVLRKVGE